MQNLFPDCVKLIGHSSSAATVVSPNPCVGPSPRIEIFLFLLSICTVEHKNNEILYHASICR